MRAVIQKVNQSHVRVQSSVISEIGKGLLVLLGVAREDSEKDAVYLAEKIPNLRIFEDDNGKMNRSLLDIGGEMLVVSQFTLMGDCKKGRRPSFIDAAPPDQANGLYEFFMEQVRLSGISVKSGKFQAFMEVSLVNEGPVTLIVESR